MIKHPLHPVSLRMTFEEKANLEKAAAGILTLYRDAATYRRMQTGERDKDRGRGSVALRPKRDRGLDLG